MSFQTELHHHISKILNPVNQLVDTHPIWENPFLKACQKGHFSLDELAYFFGQYAHYSRNFTRGLAHCMATLEDDYWRARLVENLWEEGGGADPNKRHTEIYKGFLKTIGVDTKSVELAPETRLFVMEWLDACRHPDPIVSVAHLSMGTEGIVARLYEYLVAGLAAAGLCKEDLHFFHLHIDCDDGHAETLMQLLSRLIDNPSDQKKAERAILAALDSRHHFFTHIYERMRWRRLAPKLDAIQAKKSLIGDNPPAQRHHFTDAQRGLVAYSNQNEKLGIDFTVEHLSFSSEVLDTRLVRIAGHATNERHKHAHETIYHVISGHGWVRLAERKIEIKAGDVVFIPRWAFHQAGNGSEAPLEILTITDYALTGRAFIGNYLKTARMDPSLAEVSTGALTHGRYDGQELRKHLDTLFKARPNFIKDLFIAIERADDRHSFSAAHEGPLEDILMAILDHLNDGPWLVQTLQSLGQEGAKLGLDRAYFAQMPAVIVKALEAAHPAAFTETLKGYWQRLLADLLSLLNRGLPKSG